MVIEDSQLRLKEIRITKNRDLQYSPVESSDRPIAAKAMIPMAVAPKSGHWFCATTSRTTSSLFWPASIPTLVPSITMIALSVSIQQRDDQRAQRNAFHQQVAVDVHD